MDLFWSSVTEAGVKPTGTVEPFYVFDNGAAGMISGCEHCAVDEFVLQGAEKRLGHSIIPTNAGTADRGFNVVS